MFQTKQSDRLKLIDFGLATKLDPSKGVKVTTGTAEFASPEVVLGKDVSFYTDMWSVGVLAFILLSGLSPFGGENDDETLENVKKCDWNMDDEPTFEGISDEAKDFIRRLLILDPKERMSVHQALDHPWLQAQPRRTSAERRMSKQIAPEQFRAVRDRVRRRYTGKNNFVRADSSSNSSPDLYQKFGLLTPACNTCVASNELGQDETSAPVAVETRQSSTGYLQQSHQSAAHAILARSARRSCTPKQRQRRRQRRAQTPGAVPERDAGMPRRSSENASALSSADQGRQNFVDEDSREWRSASIASDSSTSK
ncbi:hypothetical protein niasHT_035777 [Heterodera trifolii]|uniref:Protein kinase domain-containing protein n=1 Tax=Heterodera trifolii TaxID=157864 RepID=A0ABD2I941_9BILA